MRVQLLGTGAAANECRYQASLLVESRSGANQILLDTGNGMDVVRRLTTAGYDPSHIDSIFVSHRHVDHAGGLEPLLLWRALQSGSEPQRHVRVFAERRVIAALRRLFQAISTVVPTLYGERLRWTELANRSPVAVHHDMGLTPFLVDHKPERGGALGCVVDMDGKRIAYSGDTRPCPALARSARSVDVLFHEAGGLDDDSEFIHMVGHSTAGDAGRAATAATASRLVLTHFPDERLIDPMLGEARRFYRGPIEMAVDGRAVDV